MGGVPTAMTKDIKGNLLELREYLRDPDADAAATSLSAVKALPSQKTTYTYDIQSRLVTMKDPAENIWTYGYDALGRKILADDPDGGITRTTYDGLDRVATTTNAKGQVLTYEYDALGRKTVARTSSTDRVEFAYDTPVEGGTTPMLGQLVKTTRFVGAKEYVTATTGFDEAYRATGVMTKLPTDSALRSLSGESFTTRYAYTADGQVSEVRYPAVSGVEGETVLGGEIVTTDYDTASQPAWMGGGFGWGTYVAAARWAPDGKPLLQDLGNTYGAAVTYHWNASTNRLEAVKLDREGVDGTELDLGIGYDAAGNVKSMVDAPSNAAVSGARDAQCFQYDGLRRLQVAWTAGDANCSRAQAQISQGIVGGPGSYWTEYSYDPLGNRTGMVERSAGQSKSTSYVHGAGDAGPHQLTSMQVTAGASTSTTAFEWDAAGNQTKRATGSAVQSMQWDAEGELASVTSGSATVSNVFDGAGNRLVRSESGKVTVFLPGGQEVTATATSVSASRWYSFAGVTVAVRTGAGLKGVSSVVSDPHGTALARVENTNRQVPVERIRTDPFGAARSGSAGTVAGHGFLGAPVDESSFTMLGARFYDQVTGTFLSVDPLLDVTLTAQFNAYAYSGNNPVTWSDPSGLSHALADGFDVSNRTIKSGPTPSTTTGTTADDNEAERQQRRVNSDRRPVGLPVVADYSYDVLNEWMMSPEFQSLLQADPLNAENVLDRDALNSQVDKFLRMIEAGKAKPLGSRDAGDAFWIFVVGGLTDADGVNATLAAKQLSELWGDGDKWDLKPYLRDAFGTRDADMAKSTQGQVRMDVFGNVNFGIMAQRLGLDESIAIRASHIGMDAGQPDPLDDHAISIGYSMAAQSPNGITRNQYLDSILARPQNATIIVND